MKRIKIVRLHLKPAVVVATMAVIFLAVVLASAQTETPLHTYPIGNGNISGIGWPGLMSQGPDGASSPTPI